MCCFLTVLLLLGPRVAGVIWWLARPLVWNTAFGSVLWPILGLIFLPWATLIYVTFSGNGGVIGFEWVWVGLGALLDIASYGGGGFANREHIPMYNRPSNL